MKRTARCNEIKKKPLRTFSVTLFNNNRDSKEHIVKADEIHYDGQSLIFYSNDVISAIFLCYNQVEEIFPGQEKTPE
jgi:hypothetical protein